MNKNNIKIIAITIAMMIFFTACGNNEAEEISLLFSDIYYPIVNKKIKHDRESIEKHIEKTDYDIDRSGGNSDLFIRDINKSDDEVYIHFHESETEDIIMSISYHLKEKDIEVGFNNYSESGEAEYDTLFTHIIGKPNEEVDKVEEQVTFLKTATNDRKVEADKEELDEPIKLMFEVEEFYENGKVLFDINTNLPNHTSGMIRLENENIDYIGQDSFMILEGKSEVGPFGQKGENLPSGEYKVTITTPLATIQDDNVYSKIGENYKNYIGDKFKEDEIGRTINYSFTINIP